MPQPAALRLRKLGSERALTPALLPVLEAVVIENARLDRRLPLQLLVPPVAGCPESRRIAAHAEAIEQPVVISLALQPLDGLDELRQLRFVELEECRRPRTPGTTVNASSSGISRFCSNNSVVTLLWPL
jgi:hypothetical protein